tara:strand:- start:22 stop:534 length:513 start_codon:yes stop_codon:yes gene_type:complete
MKNNNSAFKLKSGNKPSFMQLRVSDNSPLKFWPALLGLIKGGVAMAGGKAALMGAALTGAANAAGGMAVNKIANKEKEETKEIMPTKQSPARKDSQNMYVSGYNQFANVEQSDNRSQKTKIHNLIKSLSKNKFAQEMAKGIGATMLTKALSSKEKKEKKPIISGQQHRIM